MYSKPETRLDKKGHIIGLILGIISLVLFVQGPNTHWSGGDFYDVLYLPFFYLIPIWLCMMSYHYLTWWRTVYRRLGLITGLVGLVAAAFGFITALSCYPLRPTYPSPWEPLIISWYMSSLVIGVAVFLIGLLSISVYLPKRTENPFGLWMGLLYVVFGLLMVLIGFATWFSAISLPLDYTLIPLVYVILIVPSILGFIK